MDRSLFEKEKNESKTTQFKRNDFFVRGNICTSFLQSVVFLLRVSYGTNFFRVVLPSREDKCFHFFALQKGDEISKLTSNIFVLSRIDLIVFFFLGMVVHMFIEVYGLVNKTDKNPKKPFHLFELNLETTYLKRERFLSILRMIVETILKLYVELLNPSVNRRKMLPFTTLRPS